MTPEKDYSQKRAEFFLKMERSAQFAEKRNYFEDASRIFSDLDDFGCICLCAVRYALGRMTYMPNLVQVFCMRNINMLDTKTLVTMIRDVTEFGETPKSYGADFDYRDWMRFRDFLENELARREEAGENG